MGKVWKFMAPRCMHNLQLVLLTVVFPICRGASLNILVLQMFGHLPSITRPNPSVTLLGSHKIWLEQLVPPWRGFPQTFPVGSGQRDVRMTSLMCKVPSQSHKIMYHSNPGERVSQLKWLSATVYGLCVEPCAKRYINSGFSAPLSVNMRITWETRTGTITRRMNPFKEPYPDFSTVTHIRTHTRVCTHTHTSSDFSSEP